MLPSIVIDVLERMATWGGVNVAIFSKVEMTPLKANSRQVELCPCGN